MDRTMNDGQQFIDELAADLATVVDAGLAREGLLGVDAGREFGGTWQVPHPHAYMARSLAGVWATAPYLHNGSVPTLVDLLDANRPATFRTGDIRLDPVNVGYCSKGDAGSFVFDTNDTNGGNKNTGHPWGTNLSPREKLDLVNYLKTL
jgi:hypothetical protein